MVYFLVRALDRVGMDSFTCLAFFFGVGFFASSGNSDLCLFSATTASSCASLSASLFINSFSLSLSMVFLLASTEINHLANYQLSIHSQTAKPQIHPYADPRLREK
jgi:hypothetical protein